MWLGHIYYILGLIPTLMVLASLVKIREYHRIKEWYSKFEEVTQKTPKKEDFRTPLEYSIFSGIGGVMIIEFIWAILGLVTQSWYIFLSLLILTVISNLLKRLININFVSIAISSIVLIVKFLLYLYLIINHFHLHCDTWMMIKAQI